MAQQALQLGEVRVAFGDGTHCAFSDMCTYSYLFQPTVFLPVALDSHTHAIDNVDWKALYSASCLVYAFAKGVW